MSDRAIMISNIRDKLDELPLDFPTVTDDTIDSSLTDALREMQITDLLSINDPNLELYIEIRAEWWQLHRIRNTASVNFKYGTSSDGRSVDKSMIPKTINNIMRDLNSQFGKWNRTTRIKTTGSTWTRIVTESTTLAGM